MTHAATSGLVYDTVVGEIRAVRSENGMVAMEITPATPLETLGFDSLMYTTLVTRLERQFASGPFDAVPDDVVFPVVVADLVGLFATQSAVVPGRTAST